MLRLKLYSIQEIFTKTLLKHKICRFDHQIFPGGVFGAAFIPNYFGIKFVSYERPMFAFIISKNKLLFERIVQFIKIVINCNVLKSWPIDYTRYVIIVGVRQNFFPLTWSNLWNILDFLLDFLGNFLINAIIKAYSCFFKS